MKQEVLRNTGVREHRKRDQWENRGIKGCRVWGAGEQRAGGEEDDVYQERRTGGVS